MEIEEIGKAMGYGISVIVSEIMLINKLIENNIPCRICSQCGEKFYTTQKAQLCPECKEKIRTRREEQQKESYKAVRPNDKPKKRKPFKSIPQIEKERAIYNKEHNTYLSYGQYVALVGE
jgi:sortase (surface protein transpeptidase)